MEGCSVSSQSLSGGNRERRWVKSRVCLQLPRVHHNLLCSVIKSTPCLTNKFTPHPPPPVSQWLRFSRLLDFTSTLVSSSFTRQQKHEHVTSSPILFHKACLSLSLPLSFSVCLSISGMSDARRMSQLPPLHLISPALQSARVTGITQESHSMSRTPPQLSKVYTRGLYTWERGTLLWISNTDYS